MYKNKKEPPFKIRKKDKLPAKVGIFLSVTKR